MIGSFAGGGTGGSGAAASIAVAMGDGLLGSGIGMTLSESDRRRALEAEYRALEYMPRGQTVVWSGARGKLRGEVVAYQPYRVGSQDCRQYVHTVHAGGEPQIIRGAACRNSDGSWTPVV